MIPISKQTLLPFFLGGGILLLGIGVFSLSSNIQSRLRANIFVSSSEIAQSSKEVGVSTKEIISIQTQTPSVSTNISTAEVAKVSIKEEVHTASTETPKSSPSSQPTPLPTLVLQESPALLYNPSPLPVLQQDPLNVLTDTPELNINTISGDDPLPMADTRRAVPPTRPRPAVNPF